MKVEFVCPFSLHSGYAQAAHDTAMALYMAGIPLSIRPLHDANSEDLDPRYGCLLERVNVFDNPTHTIVMTIPRYAHEVYEPEGIKICYTTWETDRLPKSDATNLMKNFDYVLVPSHFSHRALLKGGCEPQRTRVIPYGFEPRFWQLEEPPPQSKELYIFYTVNLWNARKAPVELLKAYWAEFTPEDRVLLRIVCQDVIEDDVRHLMKCFGLNYLAPVSFIRERLPETELRNLHYTSNCYVTLARGEAWALGAFEAAIVGNPVIATGFGGQEEFLDSYEKAYMVDYSLTPAVTPEVKASEPISVGGISITPMKRAVPTGIAGDQNWAEPDIADARRAMRYCYEKKIGRSNLPDYFFAGKFSYKIVGDMWKAFLEGATREKEGQDSQHSRPVAGESLAKTEEESKSG